MFFVVCCIGCCLLLVVVCCWLLFVVGCCLLLDVVCCWLLFFALSEMPCCLKVVCHMIRGGHNINFTNDAGAARLTYSSGLLGLSPHNNPDASCKDPTK